MESQFRDQFLCPCLGRSFRPSSIPSRPRPKGTLEASAPDYAPYLSLPILQPSTSKASLKWCVRRVRGSGLDFPEGLNAFPLTSVPSGFSMLTNSISSTVTRCRKPYCPPRSPRACSLATAPELRTNHTAGKRKAGSALARAPPPPRRSWVARAVMGVVVFSGAHEKGRCLSNGEISWRVLLMLSSVKQFSTLRST